MPEQKQDSKELLKRLVAGGTQGLQSQMSAGNLALLGILPAMPLIRKSQRGTLDVPDEFRTTSQEQIEDLADRIAGKTGYKLDPGRDLEIHMVAKPEQSGFIKEYFTKKHPPRDIFRFALGTSPTTVAHEIGHATQKGLPSKALFYASSLARTPYAMAIPSLLALSGALNPKEDLPVQSKAAPYLGAAITGSILAEEARANIVGMRALKQLGMKLPLSAKLKMFLPMLTYLAPAALTVGAPVGINKGLLAYQRAKERGHKPTVKGLFSYSPETIANLPTTKELEEKWKSKL